MKRFLLFATALAVTAPAAKADDAPVRAWVAHEERIKSLEDRVAALEAQPRAAQPAATLPAAPAFEVVSYDYGRTWVTRPVPGTASAPAFATPVRSAAYQMFAPRSACPGGVCPR